MTVSFHSSIFANAALGFRDSAGLRKVRVQ
jgi:hypothetical protein